MHLRNLYFHIYYCNDKVFSDMENYSGKITGIANHHKLIYISGGRGSIIISGKKYPIKEGTLLYLADIKGSYTMKLEEPIHLLSVLFTYAKVERQEGNWNISESGYKLPLQPIQELQDFYGVEEWFKKLTFSWKEKLPGYEFITKTYLQELLYAIVLNKKNKEKNYGNSLKVERVIAYMQENKYQKLTLKELSDFMNLSAYYLSKIFKESTGYSIIDYFNKMKIDEAKAMLAEGNIKIKEIAKKLGFSDEFYFSRIFKKTEGVSPSEFCNKNVHGV